MFCTVVIDLIIKMMALLVMFVVVLTLKYLTLQLQFKKTLWDICGFKCHTQSTNSLCCYHPLNHSTPSELHTAISCDLDYILHYITNRNDAVVAGHFNSFNTNFLERDFGLKQMVTAATHCSKTIDKSS